MRSSFPRIWPQAAWAAAEAESARLQRAVLAQVSLDRGRYVIVRAAEPAGYALEIELQRMVPWNDWPLPRDGAVRIALVQGGQQWLLQAGDPATTGPWVLAFSKHLAADSQSFDLRLSRTLGWSALPWGRTSSRTP